jgi:transcriptional regulator with XRE-family HTH domain
VGKRGPKPKEITLPKRLLEKYQSGAINLSDLAKSVGVSVTRIFRELCRLGIDTSRTRNRLQSQHLSEQIVSLYSGGLSLRRVALRTGVSQETVRQILLRSRVKLRPSWVHYPFRDADGEMIDAERFGARLRALRYAAGLSLAELAAKSGLHKATIWKLEAGYQGPKWETLIRLSEAIGVGLDAFGLSGVRPA